ncbi:MAG TPA: phage tail protein [Beijerinckiaceae bacterium]|jgi:phage-related protein
MTLQTFAPPVPPTAGGVVRKQQLKLLKASFGDGYSQTTRDGLNHMRRVVDLTWEVLTPAQADAIVDFLEDHGGDLPFLYTAPGDDTARRWTCDTWQETHIVHPYRAVTATFEQSFSLVP